MDKWEKWHEYEDEAARGDQDSAASASLHWAFWWRTKPFLIADLTLSCLVTAFSFVTQIAIFCVLLPESIKVNGDNDNTAFLIALAYCYPSFFSNCSCKCSLRSIFATIFFILWSVWSHSQCCYMLHIHVTAIKDTRETNHINSFQRTKEFSCKIIQLRHSSTFGIVFVTHK